MIVELRPETERLVLEEIQSGHFESLDELITSAIRVMRGYNPIEAAPRKRIIDVLRAEPFAGSGLDLERQEDLARPINL